jgi:hypothetical protein
MIKLYKYDEKGKLILVDYGVRGMEQAYLRQGYIIMPKNGTAYLWAESLAR